MIICDQKLMKNMLGHLLSTSGTVPDPLESFKMDFDRSSVTEHDIIMTAFDLMSCAYGFTTIHFLYVACLTSE